MEKNIKISIVIPIHNMKGGAEFLWKSINAIMEQSFKDYEIIIVKDGKMAENTNSGIRKAKGELIKVLYLDDMLYTKDALQKIVDAFTPDVNWLATGCVHIGSDGIAVRPHIPYYNHQIEKGLNTIGSPSVITIRNTDPLLFDENMSWLLDCHYYKRLYERYGLPTIINEPLVAIGVGDHQMTNILTDEEKQKEHKYLQEKYRKGQ